ncbi:hypothetical protein [Streptomyces sp. NPDC050535]|uniref:hypothetical protein n=1 Tax=Streptomyces sp. NPDC050535 TaxID=3365626 RepID=UPI0037A0DAEB
MAQGAGGSETSLAPGDRVARTGGDQSAVPHRSRARAGLRLRQGEVFGLSPEDVDFARGVLRIRRQVQLLRGRLYFTLPKGGKTRVVDMPPSVAAALAQYFMEYPAVEVELPWGGPEPDRETKKFLLVITTTYGNALRANIFNVEVWKSALAAVGVIPTRQKGERWKASRKDGFHVLWHTYASVILEAGESVVTLTRWLGLRARRSPWTTTPTSCRRPEGRGAGPSTLCSANLYWTSRRPLHTTHETGGHSDLLCPPVSAFHRGSSLLSVLVTAPRLRLSAEASAVNARDRENRNAAHSPQILPSDLEGIVGASDRSRTAAQQRLVGLLLRASPSA